MNTLNDYLPTAPQPAPHPATVAQPLVLGETIVVSELSDKTKEVIEHFGLEAPKLLNDYSCAVEDALIEQVKKVRELTDLIEVIKAVHEVEGFDFHAALERCKTDPTIA